MLIILQESDFHEIPEEDRSRQFIKSGGILQPDSPEKLAQECREATTLMVFHPSPEDIPPTPKEPPSPNEQELISEELPFGEPPGHVKARQDRYYMMSNPSPASSVQQQSPSNGLDISTLLRVVQSQSQPQPQMQPALSSQPPPPAADHLEQTVNLFRQQQPQQIPQMAPPAPIPQSQPPPAQKVDFQQILAVLNAQKQMQQLATPQPQLQPAPPPPPLPPQSQPVSAPNLAAVISQLANPADLSQVQESHPEAEHKNARKFDGAGGERLSKKSKKAANNNKEHKVCGRQ